MLLVLLCVGGIPRTLVVPPSSILHAFNVPPCAAVCLSRTWAAQLHHAASNVSNPANDAQLFQLVLVRDPDDVSDLDWVFAVVAEVVLYSCVPFSVLPDVGEHISFLTSIIVNCALVFSGSFFSLDTQAI